MMSFRTRALLVLVAVSLLSQGAPMRAEACSCAPVPSAETRVRQYLSGGETMLIGTVERMAMLSSDPKGAGSDSVWLRVDRVFLGDAARHIELPVGDGNTCGYAYGPVGTRHFVSLVQGWPHPSDDGELQANGCSSFEVRPGDWYYERYGEAFLATLVRVTSPREVPEESAPALQPVPVAAEDGSDAPGWPVAVGAGLAVLAIAAGAGLLFRRVRRG